MTLDKPVKHNDTPPLDGDLYTPEEGSEQHSAHGQPNVTAAIPVSGQRPTATNRPVTRPPARPGRAGPVAARDNRAAGLLSACMAAAGPLGAHGWGGQ